ncbi:MAG: hypothetical protein DRI24_24175, partial [Deltaproteobacteria bacterium]
LKATAKDALAIAEKERQLIKDTRSTIMNMTATKGRTAQEIFAASTSKALTEQRRILAAATIRLTGAERALGASRMALATTTGLALTVGRGLLMLVGGWAGVAIIAAGGLYYLYQKTKELSEETQRAMKNAADFGAQVTKQGAATQKAQNAYDALVTRLRELGNEYNTTQGYIDDFGDALGLREGRLQKISKEMKLVSDALDIMNTRFIQQAMNIKLLADAEAGLIVDEAELAAALQSRNESTHKAIEALLKEAEVLAMSAEEKYIYNLVTKAMKENLDAEKESLEKVAQGLWDEVEATKAVVAAEKARVKHLESINKALDKVKVASAQYTLNLEREVQYLEKIASSGQKAADRQKEMNDLIANSLPNSVAHNQELLKRKWALEDATKATVSATKATTELTNVIDVQIDAYKKLMKEVDALANEAYDIQILEAQAAGHGEIAKQLEVEKVAMEKYNAQKENMIRLTYAQILQKEEYKRALEEQAQAVEDSTRRQEEAWSNMIENVQKAWGDLFYGYMEQALMDGEFSFADFRDNIWRMFIRLLADMAAKWATTAIFGGGMGVANVGIMAGLSGIATGLTGVATAATTAVAGWLGFETAAAAATTTAMGAMAPAAEAAQFAAMQTAAQSGGTVAASAASSPLLAAAPMIGLAAYGLYSQAQNKAKREAVAAEALSANLVGAFSTAEAAFLGMSDASTSFTQSLSASQVVAGQLTGNVDMIAASMNAVGLSVERGNNGILKMSGSTEKARAVMSAFNSEAASGLREQINLMAQRLASQEDGVVRSHHMAEAVSVVTAEFAQSAIEAAGLADQINSIPSEIKTTHYIDSVTRAVNGISNDSFASGTGGYRTVPYDGYQPTLHKGEDFNVIPAAQVSSGGGSNGDIIAALE